MTFCRSLVFVIDSGLFIFAAWLGSLVVAWFIVEWGTLFNCVRTARGIALSLVVLGFTGIAVWGWAFVSVLGCWVFGFYN